MRIYLSGSHSVGKSTLARHISERYHLPMIREVARTILSEKELQVDSLRSDINVVNDYQLAVFNRQIEEEAKHEYFVSDRSLIDCLAYAASHSTILGKLMDDPKLKHYVEALKHPKTLVFFVRPSKATLQDDGVREHLTWDGIVSIDAQIKLLLEMFGVRYFSIQSDSMQERIRSVAATISLIE